MSQQFPLAADFLELPVIKGGWFLVLHRKFKCLAKQQLLTYFKKVWKFYYTYIPNIVKFNPL